MLPPQLAAGVAAAVQGASTRDLARSVQTLTAMWAAVETWPSLEEITLVESDPRMIAVGRQLAEAASSPAVREARWCAANMTTETALPPSELVIAAYSLGELPPARLGEVVGRLWSVCPDIFVIVEPGTPKGLATVRSSRELLCRTGATILAPCPHQGVCPMADGRWCHFSERLGRSRLHRAAKGAALAYEDEKYSYVAVSRSPGRSIEARVIGHPRTRPGRVSLDLCTADGLRSETVSRRDRDRYRAAQRARWGATFNESPRADEAR